MQTPRWVHRVFSRRPNEEIIPDKSRPSELSIKCLASSFSENALPTWFESLKRFVEANVSRRYLWLYFCIVRQTLTRAMSPNLAFGPNFRTRSVGKRLMAATAPCCKNLKLPLSVMFLFFTPPTRAACLRTDGSDSAARMSDDRTVCGSAADPRNWDMADKAREEQGSYEAETVPTDHTHSDCLHRKMNCIKYPGHHGFIPSPEFSLVDIPIEYRDTDVFDYISVLSYLTVKVEVRKTSRNRPSGYLHHKHIGRSFCRIGSGLVDRVSNLYSDSTMPCPCLECEQSGQPKQQWWRIRIATARHVVFDDEEAKHTLVELFFEHDSQRDSAIKIKGLSVSKCCKDGDWCLFDCATHDKELAGKLFEKRKLLKESGQKMNQKHKENPTRMTIVVSHPHGCAKQISLGKWVKREWIFAKNECSDADGSYYLYDTPTCPGSSGAPVRFLGLGGYGGHGHTHCKGPGDHGNYNRSGTSWDGRP